MKGYKAFKKGMICDPTGKNPFQYKENTVFEQESDPIICKRGFHFCKNPLDVLEYYPLVDDDGNISEFAEVESLEEPITDDDKKYSTKKIRIGAKISFAKLVKASIEFIFESVKDTNTKKTKKDNEKIGSSGGGAKIGSSGDCAQIGSSGGGAKIGSSGDWAKIGSSGDWAKIGSSGDWAQIGSSGDRAKIGSSGDWAKIGSSGDCAKIGSSGGGAKIGSSGDWAKIGSSGDCAKIGSSGDCAKIGSSGKNSVICCAGNGCCVKAKKGSWITLSEWDIVDGEYIPVCVKTVQVDGEIIKEDVFYKLENGEFVEVI